MQCPFEADSSGRQPQATYQAINYQMPQIERQPQATYQAITYQMPQIERTVKIIT